MISCIDLVKKCVVGVECARANQVVAHLNNNNNTGNGNNNNNGESGMCGSQPGRGTSGEQ